MNARVDPAVQSVAEKRDVEPVVMPAQTTPPQAANSVTAQPKKKGGARRLIIMVSVPVVLAIAGGYFFLTGGRYEDTDNANVQQTLVAVSADVSGRIVDVEVKQNEMVKAGDLLFRIDPAPYQIALDQAQAALAAARVSVAQLRVTYSTAEAKLKAATATLDIRQREQSRITSLAGKGFSTAAASDDVLLSTQQAETDVALAEQGLAGAEAALGGNPDIATEDHPSVRAALAAVENAERNLAATKVFSLADGVVSQIESLNVGQFVGTGTTIASLVETGKTWVEANFKETQLGAMRVGQPAEVKIDAYPGATLEGKVASIGAATGSQFSLIPAQNATGNWVKVVQRVPVRIVLDDDQGLGLRSGMSAAVTIDTGKSRLDLMR